MPTLGLSDVLEAFGQDLVDAETRAEEAGYGLFLDAVTAELEIIATESGEKTAQLGVLAWVVGASAGGKRERTTTGVHRVILSLTSHGPPGPIDGATPAEPTNGAGDEGPPSDPDVRPLHPLPDSRPPALEHRDPERPLPKLGR
ncbi:trypco2 family protein [Embleya scabrispora]|uniref:trypco2 family protein n=1 Tax=Embleya scabrispora TaxID=159449 RepID=UPI00099E040F|nr:trypco2 family protein [Embleya scabrispora]